MMQKLLLSILVLVFSGLSLMAQQTDLSWTTGLSFHAPSGVTVQKNTETEFLASGAGLTLTAQWLREETYNQGQLEEALVLWARRQGFKKLAKAEQVEKDGLVIQQMEGMTGERTGVVAMVLDRNKNRNYLVIAEYTPGSKGQAIQLVKNLSAL